MRRLDFLRKNSVSFLFVLSFLLLLTSSFTGCSKPSQEVPEFSGETKAAFTAAVDIAFANATHKRGISVAVYKDGYKMWTYAKGFADGGNDSSIDAATGAPMTTTTHTFAYSITKTVVSALVLTQIENNLYSLTDTVDSLLGNNADYLSLSAGQQALINKNATVEQLLTHTSGMLDYAGNIGGLIPFCDPSYTTWKPVDILEHIVYQTPVAPGVFHYSNTNYVLLGMIAEEMGGAPLNTLLANTFFQKLNIAAILAPQDVFPPANIAHPYDDTSMIGLALGFVDYSLFLHDLIPGPPPWDIYLGIGKATWAAGGIITTAENLAKWGYALYDPKGTAVTASVRNTLKNSATTDDTSGYGVVYNDFTYVDGTVGGEYSHGGSAPGYKTLLVYEKAKGITVAIIANVNNIANSGSGCVNQWTLAEDIFDGYQEPVLPE